MNRPNFTSNYTNEIPIMLLLEADPSTEAITPYLHVAEWLVVRKEHEVMGVLGMVYTTPSHRGVKNLSVKTE